MGERDPFRCSLALLKNNILCGVREMLGYLLKLHNKKGFTLIELIVVLVILAILAAAAVPAMMGYVEKARAAQHYAEIRAAIVSAKVAMELINAVAGNSYVESFLYPAPPLEEEKGQDKLFAQYLEENLDSEICDRISVFIHFDQQEGVTEMAMLSIKLYFSEGRTGERLEYEEGSGAANPGRILHYDKNGDLIE